MMATGNLEVQLTDLAGNPVRDITIDLRRLSGPAGAGGEAMNVTLAGPTPELTITGITCRSGPGTMYRVLAMAEHYRPYGFFQLIQEDRNNTASDDVEFWVKPSDVTNIRVPRFADLPARARFILEHAQMVRVKPEDADLVGLTGEDLYDQLGPLRSACFLNLIRKTSDETTTGNCLPSIGGVMVCRQDRFFARVDAALPQRLRESEVFKSAPETLHEPLAGFEMAEGSFKSRDAHANLQITFMREIASGALAADIDIDESSGLKHGLEVIRNATFNKRTNPYLIREFLLSADPINRSLDPGYSFMF
ncbi:MAG: hypothetical protein ACRD2A_05635 [Vicinamibacterales bacterium]